MNTTYGHKIAMDTGAGPETTVEVGFHVVGYSEIRILELKSDRQPLSLEDIESLLNWILDDRKEWKVNEL